MKSYRRFNEHSWLLLTFLLAVVFLTAGCSSSRSSSGVSHNPLGAYQTSSGTSSGGVLVDGSTNKPGAISSPIISIPDSSGSIDGHDNAPLLDNMHPGWQQDACLSCHNDASLNPDHNYTDSSLCYLCHGTNGLPGFGDNIPPVISGVVTSVSDVKTTLSWRTDEPCLSRLVLRTTAGDRLEFPVSMTYNTSHLYEVVGLVPSTTYTYEIVCTDKSGNRTSTASFGTLTFTTLAPITTTITDSTTMPVPDPGETTGFFTNFTVESDGSFKCKLKFGLKSPAVCTVFFVYKSTGNLDNTKTLSDGRPIESYNGSVTGLQSDTEYVIYVEARDQAASKTYTSRKVTIKTDKFD